MINRDVHGKITVLDVTSDIGSEDPMLWHDMIWHDMIWYNMIWYENMNQIAFPSPHKLTIKDNQKRWQQTRNLQKGDSFYLGTPQLCTSARAEWYCSNKYGVNHLQPVVPHFNSCFFPLRMCFLTKTNTLRPKQMAAILQRTFSNTFCQMKIWYFGENVTEVCS